MKPQNPSPNTTPAKQAVSQLGHALAGLPPTAAKIEVSGASVDTEGVWLVILSKTGAVLRHVNTPQEVALKDVDVIFDATEAMRTSATPPTLPEGDAALLDAGGLRHEPLAAAVALEHSQRALAELLDTGSMSLAQTAKAVGVSTSRLRQRLGVERTLYGIKHGGEWRVPLFQFAPSKKKSARRTLVFNFDKVLPAVPDDVNPLAVRAFFLSESPDLVLDVDGQETAVSPLAWLAAGNSPDAVRALAQEL